jgi:hypothetical protein
LYYYQVSAQLTAGESQKSYLVFAAPMAAAALNYSADFNGNNGGFIGTDDWQWGTPNFVDGPALAASIPNCWGTNLTGNYSSDSYSWLEKAFDMSPDSVTISYKIWYDCETDYDYAYLAIDSENDGLYSLLKTYNGTSGGWITDSVTLPTAHATAYARLSFILEADDLVEYAGCYIDDLQITSANLYVPTPQNVSITVSGGSPHLSWNAVAGATGYNIYASDDITQSNWGAPIFTNVTTTNVTDTSNQNFRFYKVTAVAGARNTEINVGNPVKNPIRKHK